MLFDSHAHYDDEAFDNDRDEVLLSLNENGVSNIINIGADMPSSIESVSLAEKYGFIYAAVGVHPHSSEGFSEADVEILYKMTKNKKVVSIGEIGLDYFYDNSPRDEQKKAFIMQMHLAKKANLPVIIHDRDAHSDCLEILKNEGIIDTGGVMHCYSGSIEMAKIILDLGMYISIAGPVTYKNAAKTLDVAKYVPSDRLLIETDCPYLSPVPQRGKRNSSLNLHYTAEKIAEIRGITLEELAKITYDNTKKLFKIGG